MNLENKTKGLRYIYLCLCYLKYLYKLGKSNIKTGILRGKRFDWCNVFYGVRVYSSGISYSNLLKLKMRAALFEFDASSYNFYSFCYYYVYN